MAFIRNKRRGTSFIDIVISLAIIASLFWGIYLIYFALIDSVTNIEARTAATELVNQQIEALRGLPYGSVGTVGGLPAGVIQPVQSASIGSYSFVIDTTVRNIDDPFDGTASGNPAPVDTAPADYKLVELDVSCPACSHFIPLSFSTTIAPANLETASSSGSLFVNVFDANGNGVPAATVAVTNSAVSPAINLTDTTNASGVLELVGVPTSTQSYHIVVSDPGYSSDQTYPLGGAGNPNPLKPDATVAASAVTGVSFAIDRLSGLSLETSDAFCAPAAAVPFTVAGTKLIGTNPDVLKFSTSSATDANGTASMSLEWDTYSFALGTSSYDLFGTIPLSPVIVNPSSSVDFRFITGSATPDALLTTVTDAATGAAIPGASVALSGAGNATLTTNHTAIVNTDWSLGNFYDESGVDTGSIPGSVLLLVNASGTYDTSSPGWLISKTIDTGSSTTNYYSFDWNAIVNPGTENVEFQLAANNDNATWNFEGPSGPGSYYTASSSIASVAGRYIRYKMFLSTTDPNATPKVDEVSFDLASACTPPGQVLFQGLGAGTYDIDITAPNYIEATSSVTVGSAWQGTTISLTHI